MDLNTQTTTPATDVTPSDTNPQSVQTEPVSQIPQPAVNMNQPVLDAATYIDNTGGSFIDLLQEITDDPALQQKVATEMHMDLPTFQTLLTTLFNKVTQGQITKEELSLLMTAPMIDDELLTA